MKENAFKKKNQLKEWQQKTIITLKTFFIIYYLLYFFSKEKIRQKLGKNWAKMLGL